MGDTYNPVIIDSDIPFTINATTRELKNESGKTVLIQYDDKSERFRFTIDKLVEGHDMSQCNLVEIHYSITEASTRKKHTGVSLVPTGEDGLVLHPSSDNPDKLEFSWLLTRSITQYAGTLGFAIRFLVTSAEPIEEVCDNCKSVLGSTDILYCWGTAVNNTIVIASSIDGGTNIEEEYADIIADWEYRMTTFDKEIDESMDEMEAELDEYINSLEATEFTRFATTAQVLAIFGISEDDYGAYLVTKYGDEILTADNDNITVEEE